MGSPVTSFEIVESIRFFAQLTATEGVSEYVKRKANDYMERLIDALEGSVQHATASSAGLTLVN